MTPLPPDVEARAKAAADNRAELLWHGESDSHVRIAAKNSCRENFRAGYVTCHTAERPRIELAALEEMVPKVCYRCGYGDELLDVSVHMDEDYDGEIPIPVRKDCPASALHARIAQLKEEIEKGG